MLLLASPLCAQRVQGIVLDRVSRRPIEAADVALLTTKGQVVGRELTGADGRFALEIPKLGAYAVKVEALGYVLYTTKTFVADSSQEISVDVDLMPAPLALSGLNVTAAAVDRKLTKDGFYMRKDMGVGDFLTPAQVKNDDPFYPSDLLEQIPGLIVRPDADGFGSAIYDQEGGFPPCRMEVVVDGEKLDPGTGETLDEDVGAQDVLAVEVYPFHGVGAPMQYRGADAHCGVILIWTKNQ